MTAADDVGFRTLAAMIARARGLDVGAYKPNCLRRRIAVRMRARGAHTYDDYARILAADAAEYDRLLDALTINVTKFYRNRETWDALAAGTLPGLWDETGGTLRCWSAGCASGEEPYTLAILLLEEARRRGTAPPRRCVDATDLDRESLARAAAGRYPASAFDEMPEPLVQRYFTGPGPRDAVAPVRALVHFVRHDLLREAPPAPPYDLILCRNVVIYFDRPSQERLYAGFARALAPHGVLVLGKVETLVGEARGMFRLLDARERIYRRAA